MKKVGIIHAELSRQVALLGHTDRFVIGDSGLPLPRTMPVIDLALAPGTVGFRETLDALLAEVVVQGHVVASESFDGAVGSWLDERSALIGHRSVVSHEELKGLIDGCVFAIRTGEQTPYANVICESGVPF